jgi:hypothetical protein
MTQLPTCPKKEGKKRRKEKKGKRKIKLICLNTGVIMGQDIFNYGENICNYWTRYFEIAQNEKKEEKKEFANSKH